MRSRAFQESYPIRTRHATPVSIWRRKGVLVNGALVVILAVAGGVTYLVVRPSSSSAPLQTTAVQQGTVLATVSSSGTLESAQDLGLNFTTGGKLTNIYVKVGQRVKAGQLLAKVDPTSSEDVLEQAEAQLSSAEAQLTAADEGETATAKKVGSDEAAQSLQSVTTAKSNLSAAQTPQRLSRSRPRKTRSPLPSRPCPRTMRR
jgi:membrane fusion protein, macrolide-specific efflux system